MKKILILFSFLIAALTVGAQHGTFTDVRLINGDSVISGTNNGTIFYNRVSNKFRFRENGVWRSLGGTGSSVWGAITGSLPSQVDLQAALDDKTDLGGPTFNSQSGTTYTLVLTDKGKLVETTNASAVTITVPTNASVAFPVGKTIVNLVQYGAGTITVAAAGGVTINSSSGTLTSPSQYSIMVLEKRATNEWFLWNGNAGFSNPMTNVGDIIQGTTAGAAVRLASVATGNALISGGVTTASSWGKITSAHIDATVLSNTTGLASGATTALTANSGQSGSFKYTFGIDGLEITQNARSSSWVQMFKATPGNQTSLTANTSFPVMTVEPYTNTWVTSGSFPSTESVYFKSPTYAFSVGSTITDAYNVRIDPPVLGTNATFTNGPWALFVNGKAKFSNSISGTTGTFTTVAGGNGQIDGTGYAGNNIRRLTSATMTMTSDATVGTQWTFNSTSTAGQTSAVNAYASIVYGVNSASGNGSFRDIQLDGIKNSAGSGSSIGFSNSVTLQSWVGDHVGFFHNPTVTSLGGTNYILYATSGKVLLPATNTAGGTTGNQTINKISGTVNIAASGTSVTVTNSTCLSTSLVFATIRTNDVTAVIKNVVPSAGSFVITLNAATTAETSIGFLVVN